MNKAEQNLIEYLDKIQPRPAEIRMRNARMAWKGVENALRSFTLAYEENNAEQLLAVYHEAMGALENLDKAFGAIRARREADDE